MPEIVSFLWQTPWVQEALFIGQGIVLTLSLLVGSLLIGSILGGILTILRYKAVLPRVWTNLISLIRGTPMILQLGFVYYAVPSLLGVRMGLWGTGILTFGLNSCAYIADIFKAGIEGLPRGQFEAAQTLRIPPWRTWKDILAPQLIRTVLPSMVHESIALLKETALISTLGGMDIMRSAQVLASEHFTFFRPLCIAGAYYYVLVLTIEYLGRRLERTTCWENAS